MLILMLPNILVHNEKKKKMSVALLHMSQLTLLQTICLFPVSEVKRDKQRAWILFVFPHSDLSSECFSYKNTEKKKISSCCVTQAITALKNLALRLKVGSLIQCFIRINILTHGHPSRMWIIVSVTHKDGRFWQLVFLKSRTKMSSLLFVPVVTHLGMLRNDTVSCTVTPNILHVNSIQESDTWRYNNA